MVDPAAGGALIACSAAMIEVLRLAKRLAPLPRPILLVGETGVGKGLLARLIHSESRRPGDFVVAAVGESPDLPAALTQARERAQGGTLFLEHLPLWPEAALRTLLRVLEEEAITPASAPREGSPAGRLIVASERSLEELVAAGRVPPTFRWWIGEFVMVVPPLRERAGDIAALSYHFLERARADFSLSGPALFDPKALNRLVTYSWPGNVPQLRGVVEWSYVRAVTGQTERIRVGDLPPLYVLADPPRVALTLAGRRDLSLWAFERAGHDRKAAAALLGVHPNTIDNHRRAAAQ